MATKKSSPDVLQSNPFSAFNSILLVILIALSALQLYFMFNFGMISHGENGQNDSIKNAILAVEYDKVGGKDAFDVITQANIRALNDSQNPQNLNAMREYLGSTAAAGDTIGTPTVTANPSEINESAVSAILENAVLENSTDPEIVVVEYSDMECPFCIRHFHETKLKENLADTFGDKVGFAFKNNRGVNHRGTEVKALGALCARKLGGDEAYVSFYTAIMEGSQMSSVYPVDGLASIAESIGLDTEAWQSCVDSREFLTQFEAETAEARSYGLGGTPGILIMNVKTGKYDTVEGAYPLNVFIDTVNTLLGE